MASNDLAGLKVIDLGVGMAAALIAKYLREAGADVTRLEPPGGDPFYEIYPAYRVWRRGLTVLREDESSEANLESLLSAADVCLVGGEDHPRIARRGDAAALESRHPRLVVLNIEGYPAGTRHAGRPACDVLVQARSGLSFEHYSRRPLLMSFAPSNYGAALHGLAGVFAALLRRESSGAGELVATSLFEGALAWAMLLWYEVEKPTPAASFVLPKDPWPLIFRCSDGVWVQLVIGSAGSKGRLYRILKIDDPTVDINDSGMPKPTADPKNFFGDVDVLAKHVANFGSRELLEAIWAAGLPAEPVLAPGACWDDPQVTHNGIVVRGPDGVRHIGHPVYGYSSPAPRAETGMASSARAGGSSNLRAADEAGAAAPLSGVKVIDFGSYVAGPYSSALLSDLGADVVKVETLTGDPNRSVFRSFASANRGKRAISIDLKHPEGLKIAQRLCVGADVVTSNFRPGVSARLGIDPKTLHALKPDLIVLESAAYGATGPRAEGAGFDLCFQALCGHDWRAGGVGNPPLWNRTFMVDYAAALLGQAAVLQSLHRRARSGAGAAVGAGLLNAGLFLMSELIQRSDGEWAGAEPINADQTGFHPAERLYQAADGWLAVAARDAAMARRFLSVLNLERRITAPHTGWDAEVGRVIAEEIRKRPLEALRAALEAAHVWVEVCRENGERDNLRDPDLERLGTVHAALYPKLGEVRQLGPLVRLAASAGARRRHAPLVGEHTDEVLAELGFSPDEIKGLRERHVVG
jgi:crotonobetainyl-CoA:carnitine CoA-transferase CaiB-like acyl-CoA transferase